MKKLIGTMAVAVLALSGAAASAADLPIRAPAPAPVLVSSFSWAGGYIGLHLGYGWTIGDIVGVHTVLPGAFRGNIGNLNAKGINGGAQVGYNFQSGSLVYGLEADVSFTGRSASVSGIVPVANLTTAKAKEDWFGSVRGRVGVAADRALFYVTGGVGFTNVKYNFATNTGIADPRGPNVASKNSTRVGYVIGAGVEYAFTNNWTARLEGLYYGLPKRRIVTTTGPFAGDWTYETQSHSDVRLGLNYKF